MRIPSTRKTITAVTLMMANQNSLSPYARADKTFRRKSNARNPTDHIQAGTPGHQ